MRAIIDSVGQLTEIKSSAATISLPVKVLLPLASRAITSAFLHPSSRVELLHPFALLALPRRIF